MDTRKFTFGYVYLLARGMISWKSAKQTIIVASTMEVEFVAYFEAIVQAIGCRTLFQDLEYSIVFCNNLLF